MTSVPGNPQPQPREELALIERAINRAPKVLAPGLAAAAVHFLREQQHNVAIVADPYVDGRKVNLLGGTVRGAKEARGLAAEILSDATQASDTAAELESLAGQMRSIAGDRHLVAEAATAWTRASVMLARQAAEIRADAIDAAEEAENQGWKAAMEAIDGYASRLLDRDEQADDDASAERATAYGRISSVAQLAIHYPERAKREIFTESADG